LGDELDQLFPAAHVGWAGQADTKIVAGKDQPQAWWAGRTPRIDVGAGS
jgi:hypothetical protein